MPKMSVEKHHTVTVLGLFQIDNIAKPLYLCVFRHIGLLKVKGRKMNLEKIPLKTVRQFLIQDVVLADYEDVFTPDTPQVTKKVENLCFAKVRLSQQPSHVQNQSLIWQSS